MRTFLMALSLAAAAAAPTFAHASCHSRKATGAVIGAVGGGLIGNALSHGNRRPGTLLGAGVGAVAGHAIGGAGCHSYYHHAYYHRRYYHRRYYGDYGPTRYDRYANYDERYPTRCETREQPFYDERGQLIYRPVQVCR